MPGVVVTPSLRTGPSAVTGNLASVTFAAGLTERGPSNVATLITSVGAFERVYGVRQSYSGALYDAVRVFFEEGGSQIYIARVVGAAAAAGILSLSDRAATPLPTLKIAAVNPGAYSTELTVAISDVTAGFVVTVARNGVQVEALGPYADVPSAVTGINTQSVTVRATNLASTSVGVLAKPAVKAATALAAGSDDRTSVTATTVTNAVNTLFPKGLGVGAVIAPGYTADLVGAALIAHCKANRRIALLSAPVGSDIPTMVALAATITADGDYAGLFGPWVVIPDGSATRIIDPVGYIAGIRANAINNNGFWQRPAGTFGLAKFVINTEYPLDESANNTLAAGGVSGIINYPVGPELFGWYSLSADKTNFLLLSTRDSLNSLTGQVEAILHDFVWRTIDGTGRVFGEIEGALQGLLQPIADAGGVFPWVDTDGTVMDPGYSVQVDSTLNPVTQLGQNIISAAIGVRFSPAIATLLVSIYQAGLNVPV